MQVSAIKAFSDNYVWAISNNNKPNIALVDPGDAQVCIDYIEQNNLILSAILITHHHRDHIGGIEKLLTYASSKNWAVNIYGPAHQDINCEYNIVNEQDTITLPALELTFSVIDLPGHTLTHIAFLTENNLFCGDTLFSAGCGRLFEGTAEQMYHSLAKLSALPEQTQVYCAHEYTQANINFALAVEPENITLVQYYNQVNALREQQAATIPTTISLEKQINPFLRCTQPALMTSASEYTNSNINEPLATFAALRAWKDNF